MSRISSLLRDVLVEPSTSSNQTAVYDDVAEYAEIGTINESKSRQAVTIATTSAAEEKVAPGQVVAVMCVCKITIFSQTQTKMAVASASGREAFTVQA